VKSTGTQYWLSPNTDATNESGFSGLPGGYNYGLIFYDVGSSGYWWSSSEYETYTAWNRYLGYNYGNAVQNNYSKQCGFSVRCLRD
jgi:uncharacterized protein (TIGR02145 family)